jgi:polysaccharide biosynthesis transport protein
MKPPSVPVSDNPTPRFDFGYIYRLLLGKIWLLILVALLSISAAIAYVSWAPKIYESIATIQVQQEAQKVADIQGVNQEDYKQSDALKTVEQSLLSQTLLLRVVKANGLDKDPEFAPPKKDGSAYTDVELAGLFTGKVAVLLRRGTRLIDVTVEDKDPQRAQQLARSMVKEFENLNFEQEAADAKAANEALIQEADHLKDKLHKADEALQRYREQYNAVSLEDKQNITVEKLKELNLKVTQAKGERLRLEADVAAIKKAKDPEQLLMVPSVAALPAVGALRQELSDKESRFRADSQLDGLRQSLNQALVSGGKVVTKSYEAAKATEASLAEALKEQEQVALELNKIAIPYNVLVREVDSDRALYDSVLKRMNETNVTKNLDQNNIRLIAEPMVPVKPAKPRKLRILALAFLGGLVLGSGIVIGIDLSDRSIRTVNEVEEILGLPVLTLVPRSKRRHLDHKPVVCANPASHEAEAFRSLRTALSFLGQRKDFKTVLFTSANPGEGKTYCSLNCAAALAQLGLRTLLVDADLRRPSLTKALLPHTKTPGLSDCLAGNETFMDCCNPTDTENLFILGAGGRASNPAELLAAGDLPGLLKEAMLYFDRVVLDSAPINAVSDTQLIAKEIESVCLVLRAGKTPRHAVIRACGLLARATHSPDAVVLNRVVPRRGEYYHARYTKMYAAAATYRRDSIVSRNNSTVDEY